MTITCFTSAIAGKIAGRLPAIQVSGLEKVYRRFGRAGRRALAGVDCEIPRGSAFGLIGLNGAGKTTFIKVLLAAVRPSRGQVRVLDGDPEDRAVRARIGYLPERLYFPGGTTPLAFLASAARLKRLADPRPEIDRQLERVGLSREAELRVGAFSKGMRQRLGLAAALLGRPELLILDEPTDGVDPLGRGEIRRILLEERRRGATIFINSHLLSETERICDRVGILHQGRIVRTGALEEFLRAEGGFRLKFASPPEVDAARELGFEPTGVPNRGAAGASSAEGWWRSDAPDPETLNRQLDRARAAGLLVVELTRTTRDLEELLGEAVRGEVEGS
jgi:ABC-2 type transport system ATP-binding protein